MTSAYLESATSSRSSIGGSVMPSGWATVPGISKPHNRWIRSNNSYYLFRGDSISLGSCAAVARATLGACAHQVYELVGRSEERRVGKECSWWMWREEALQNECRGT